MDDDAKMAKIHKTLKEYFPDKIIEISATQEEIKWCLYDINAVVSFNKKKKREEVSDD